MTSSLPPDPYKSLGVSKDAKLPEIRSAHRKLVLKCHPDKVQDAALKALKQEEFQKVQQAYELLSDDARRLQYDEQVKLFELRKEMGRGVPTPRSNPFEFEDKNAEPRPSSYNRPPPKVYSYQASGSRSHEDVMYDESMRHLPRKSSSAEYSERKRPVAKESDRERARRREQEDEIRRMMEKDAKRAHSDKKKSRDKERRSRTEEKTRARATGVYVEDDSSDEYRPRSSDKKSRHRTEDHAREREEAMRFAEAQAQAQRQQTIKEAPMSEKWDAHMRDAAKYMQRARLNSDPEEEATTFHPRMPPRAETFSGPSPSAYVRYTAPPAQFSDEDTPRRSSGRKSESRRTSETPPVRREKSRGDRRSPIDIVSPPSPPPTNVRRPPPPLQTFASAPPVFASREKPSRSKTQDYPRKEAVPPLPRSNTYNVDGRTDRHRERERGGSRLRKEYISSESSDEEPIYSPRVSQSPPPISRQQTRYVVQNGHTIPVSANSHRHRDSHDREEYSPRQRTVSPSPGSRPSLYRNPPSTRDIPTHSPPTTGYYPPTSGGAKPIVMEARPKMHTRGESAQRSSGRSGLGVSTGGAGFPFEKISYAPSYTPENVSYSRQIPIRSAEEYYVRGRGGMGGGEGVGVYAS